MWCVCQPGFLRAKPQGVGGRGGWGSPRAGSPQGCQELGTVRAHRALCPQYGLAAGTRLEALCSPADQQGARLRWTVHLD